MELYYAELWFRMYTMRERKSLKKLGPGECTKSECVADFSSSESSCRIAIILGLIHLATSTLLFKKLVVVLVSLDSGADIVHCLASSLGRHRKHTILTLSCRPSSIGEWLIVSKPVLTNT